MACDFTVDDVLDAPLSDRRTLPKLAKELGVAPPTVWRWVTKGIDGVKLPAAKAGGAWVSTHAAHRWWSREMTARASGQTTQSSQTRSRQRQIDAAQREAAELLKS